MEKENVNNFSDLPFGTKLFLITSACYLSLYSLTPTISFFILISIILFCKIKNNIQKILFIIITSFSLTLILYSSFSLNKNYTFYENYEEYKSNMLYILRPFSFVLYKYDQTVDFFQKNKINDDNISEFKKLLINYNGNKYDSNLDYLLRNIPLYCLENSFMCFMLDNNKEYSLSKLEYLEYFKLHTISYLFSSEKDKKRYKEYKYNTLLNKFNQNELRKQQKYDNFINDFNNF